MSNIPIVQGVSVGPDSKYNNNASSYQTVQDHDPAVPLTTQQLEELRTHPIAKFQDVIWAILFVVHWIAVSAVIIANMRNNNMHISAIDLGSLTFVISVSGLTAVGLSIGGLSFMMQHSEILVQTALIFTVGTSLVIAVLGFMMGSMLMGFLGLFSFAVGICYARVVWPRIPFAAVNLETGLTCVRSNLGLTIVSLLFTAIAFAWSLFWFLGVGNALNASNAAIIFVLVSSKNGVDVCIRSSPEALIDLKFSNSIGTTVLVVLLGAPSFDEHATCYYRRCDGNLVVRSQRSQLILFSGSQ
jgi:hypothetical protein